MVEVSSAAQQDSQRRSSSSGATNSGVTGSSASTLITPSSALINESSSINEGSVGGELDSQVPTYAPAGTPIENMSVSALRTYCRDRKITGLSVKGKKKTQAELVEVIRAWEASEGRLVAAVATATGAPPAATPSVSREARDDPQSCLVRLLNIGLLDDEVRPHFVLQGAKPTSMEFSQKKTGARAPVWEMVAERFNSSAPNPFHDTLVARVHEVGVHDFYKTAPVSPGDLRRKDWTQEELRAMWKGLQQKFKPFWDRFDRSGHHDQGEDSFADFISPSQVRFLSHMPHSLTHAATHSLAVCKCVSGLEAFIAT
eukprot:GHVU01216819.1.p1 GENE.GHVU01216819.1~~GHVU01216819.1.p1  ORF type:complete len:314 (+),score=37.29 GHVU01216819.1:1296-2237(+)